MNIKGVFQIWMADGEYHEVNLKECHAWTREGCTHCPDFAAEHADISCGGIGENADWTLTIVRTDLGREIISRMIADGSIESRPGDSDPGAIALMRKLVGEVAGSLAGRRRAERAGRTAGTQALSRRLSERAVVPGAVLTDAIDVLGDLDLAVLGLGLGLFEGLHLRERHRLLEPLEHAGAEVGVLERDVDVLSVLVRLHAGATEHEVAVVAVVLGVHVAVLAGRRFDPCAAGDRSEGDQRNGGGSESTDERTHGAPRQGTPRR